MHAMVLEAAHHPLRWTERPMPIPGPTQLLLQVKACGVCRTDLHIVDGELDEPKLPLVLGHQIVGRVVALGDQVGDFQIGQRVGVPWLGQTCQHCRYCQSQQ
ncbi:MAG: alcohol dehydrogenase catalytic domain-containing protein, partial [Cyanobacteria bacterium J06628_4]